MAEVDHGRHFSEPFRSVHTASPLFFLGGARNVRWGAIVGFLFAFGFFIGFWRGDRSPSARQLYLTAQLDMDVRPRIMLVSRASLR